MTVQPGPDTPDSPPETVGSIGSGLLLLWCVMRGDTDEDIAWLVRKIATMRLFRSVDGDGVPDGGSSFDRSIAETGGELLVVSQFTLAARTKKGRRPDFPDAAPPEEARAMCEQAVAALRAEGLTVATGRFGADMQVSLINDGPVTIWLDSRDRR